MVQFELYHYREKLIVVLFPSLAYNRPAFFLVLYLDNPGKRECEMKKSALLSCLVLAAAFLPAFSIPEVSENQTTQKPAGPRVRYAIVGGGAMSPAALYATVDGKSHQVIPKSQGKCLNIVSQRDFAGSGILSALVMHSVACGGNCCPDKFFFVSYLGDGQFKVSSEFADSWKEPEIEKWKGRWSVVVVSNNAGMNQERPLEFTRRFVLQDGEAAKMEEHQRSDLKTIVEIRSEVFKGTPGEEHTIKYDLTATAKKT